MSNDETVYFYGIPVKETSDLPKLTGDLIFGDFRAYMETIAELPLYLRRLGNGVIIIKEDEIPHLSQDTLDTLITQLAENIDIYWNTHEVSDD